MIKVSAPVEKQEVLEVLKWAAMFAEGSRDLNPKLNNPKFNEWLARCDVVIKALEA